MTPGYCAHVAVWEGPQRAWHTFDQADVGFACSVDKGPAKANPEWLFPNARGQG